MNIKSIEEHGISFYTFIFEKESKELKKNGVKETYNFGFVKLFCIETISLYDLCLFFTHGRRKLSHAEGGGGGGGF